MPSIQSRSLTLAVAKDLAQTLVRVADHFPLNFITKRDLYPLIHTYLSERVPGVTSERTVKAGQTDFRAGGTNPALVELAVAPRAFADARRPEVIVPGFSTAPQLYATQNMPELRKLLFTDARYANRYLLLIDLRGDYDFVRLQALYRTAARKIKKKDGAVSVIYARHGFCDRF